MEGSDQPQNDAMPAGTVLAPGPMANENLAKRELTPVERAIQQLDIELDGLFSAVEMQANRVKPLLSAELTATEAQKNGEPIDKPYGSSKIVSDILKRARKIRDARMALKAVTQNLEV